MSANSATTPLFDVIRWRNQARFNQMCYTVNETVKATLSDTYDQFWREVESSILYQPRTVMPVETIVVRGRKIKVSDATQHIVEAAQDGQLSMFDDSGAFAVSAAVGTPEWEAQIDTLFERLDANGNVPVDAKPKTSKRIKISKPKTTKPVKLTSKTPKLSNTARRQQLKNLACVIGLATFGIIAVLSNVL